MESVRKAADWAGWPLTDSQTDQLARFGSWLEREAIPAGGLGPHEGERIVSRHLADSLLFAAGWPHSRPPRAVLDLGAGVGLPGIPLAILWPATGVCLVDRAVRRTDLARRAVRVVNLTNVEVKVGDAATISGIDRAEMVVSRALARPEEVMSWAGRLVESGGVVVVGGSHRRPPAPVRGERIMAVPPEILDQEVWLRIMATQ